MLQMIHRIQALILSLTITKLIYNANAVQRYESIDVNTFHVYENSWLNSHSSWIDVKPDSIGCPTLASRVVFPVCQGGFVVGGQNPNEFTDVGCSNVQCYIPSPDNCLPTPFDTIDYLPILPTSTNEDPTICKPPTNTTSAEYPYFGLFEGTPPLYTPVSAIRLLLSGTVRASFEDRCEIVQGATIRAWQIDPTDLRPFSALSEKLDTFADAGTVNDGSQTSGYTAHVGRTQTGRSSTTPSPPSLRNISCTGMVRTDGDGNYAFNTTMPPSYGPPRHIAITVSAPGFETLNTRIYFDQDGRLQQLVAEDVDIISPTKIYGKIGVFEGNPILGSINITSQILLGNDDGFQAALHNEAFGFQGSVTRDPRVAKLRFIGKSVGDGSNVWNGFFMATFDIVLRWFSFATAAVLCCAVLFC